MLSQIAHRQSPPTNLGFSQPCRPGLPRPPPTPSPRPPHTPWGSGQLATATGTPCERSPRAQQRGREHRLLGQGWGGLVTPSAQPGTQKILHPAREDPPFWVTILMTHVCPSPPTTPKIPWEASDSGVLYLNPTILCVAVPTSTPEPPCLPALVRGPRHTEFHWVCGQLARRLCPEQDGQPRCRGPGQGGRWPREPPARARPTPNPLYHSCPLVTPWRAAEDRLCQPATHRTEPSDFQRLNYADGFSGF